MKSSAVLVLACLASTVFGAPAHGPKSSDKPSTAAKQVNALEAELEEAENHVSDEVHSSQDREPEVKRSERVSTDETDEVMEEEEDDFTGLSGNMKEADQDVKDVLKTFFQNLKDHPEIVEEILGREGDKILQQSAEEQALATNADDVMDVSAFQKPSPQLIKSPKQVEKKTGEFPAYPRFIYKSPMRNAAERDEMTSSAGQSKPQQRSGPNGVTVDNTGKFKVDISNAIPVIQQPSTMHKTDDSVSIVPDQLEEGGVDDIDTLREEQDEYSQQHPFINPLPIFPQPADHAPDQSYAGPEDVHQGAAEAHSQSEDTLPEKKSNQNEAEASHEEEEEDQKPVAAAAPQADATASSSQSKPHYLTGQEIAAETLAHPVEQESSVPFYYYYYDADSDGEGAGEVDEDEEDDDAQDDESQLNKISNENEEEEGDAGEEEDEDDDQGEDGEEDENTDEVDSEDDEEEDVSEEPETDVSEENGDETDENTEAIEENTETDENIHENEEIPEKGKQVQHSKVHLPQNSRFLETRPQHTNMNHLDPDEAALMSLAGRAQRQKGRVVGPAM